MKIDKELKSKLESLRLLIDLCLDAKDIAPADLNQMRSYLDSIRKRVPSQCFDKRVRI